MPLTPDRRRIFHGLQRRESHLRPSSVSWYFGQVNRLEEDTCRIRFPLIRYVNWHVAAPRFAYVNYKAKSRHFRGCWAPIPRVHHADVVVAPPRSFVGHDVASYRPRAVRRSRQLRRRGGQESSWRRETPRRRMQWPMLPRRHLHASAGRCRPKPERPPPRGCESIGRSGARPERRSSGHTRRARWTLVAPLDVSRPKPKSDALPQLRSRSAGMPATVGDPLRTPCEIPRLGMLSIASDTCD
jgi:hypothetical protein